MAEDVPPELKDHDTPADVVIRRQAPAPRTDPTLGVQVEPPAGASRARHRLVALGDSFAQGFQSFAVSDSDLSFPAIIASELGWLDQFRRPEYPGFGGLPLNLEYLVRELEKRFGAELSWWELPAASILLYHAADEISEYWERGPGAQVPKVEGIMHNLAVSGYDVRDLITMTADVERKRMQNLPPTLVSLVARDAGPLMARYVLESARDARGRALTPVQAAAAHGEDGGIETLIVCVGSSNVLRSVADLTVRWSGDDYANPDTNGRYTVWRPTHFAAEMRALMEQVRTVKAEHVVWATVPHVTIAPAARGIGAKMYPGSRYFPYYTHPWVSDDKFDPAVDACLTGNQARAIDSAIDQYNDAIADGIVAARREGLDWLLLDTCGLLDRLASRRYLQDPAARPPWWTPYELPPVLAQLHPPPDSRFLAASRLGRISGGIFSLDGVHPTTIAYGLLAREFIRVMSGAGVPFSGRAGADVDLAGLLGRDKLLTDTPKSITPDLRLLGWANELLDWKARLGHLFSER